MAQMLMGAAKPCFVSSERDGVRSGEIELTVLRTDGEIMQTRRFPVRLDGRGGVSLGEIELADYAARRFDCLAVFVLRLDDGTVARNVYTFSRPKHMRLPAPHIDVHQATANKVTVRCDVFAKGVYLFHPDTSVIFGDNYFDLLPGEERTIDVSKGRQALRTSRFCAITDRAPAHVTDRQQEGTTRCHRLCCFYPIPDTWTWLVISLALGRRQAHLARRGQSDKCAVHRYSAYRLPCARLA